MSGKHPIARRARLGLDKLTTASIVVPRIKVITINGVKGIWVPLHPLAEYKETK